MDARKKYIEVLFSTVIKGNAPIEEKQAKMSQLFQLRNSFMPPTLFRYRSCSDYDYAALLSDRVYFNRPKNFNDPHDCLMYIDMDKVNLMKIEMTSTTDLEQMKNFLQSGMTKDQSPNLATVISAASKLLDSVPQEEIDRLAVELQEGGDRVINMTQAFSSLMERQHDENQRSAREDTFIACFSDALCLTTMWSHYANNHKGFALEYDTTELSLLSGQCAFCQVECDRRHVTGLYPVIYGKERYDSTDFEIETYKASLARYVNQFNGFTSPDILHTTKLNTLKGDDWAYEREWRLVYTPMSVPSNSPVYEIIRPKAIYFGSQMPESQKDVLKELIRRDEGSKIAIYQMYVDTNSREYRMDHVNADM